MREEIHSQYIFGTYIAITVYGSVEQSGIDQVFIRNRDIHNAMSTSEGYEGSELMRLNQTSAGSPFQLSPDTYTLLEKAWSYAELSDGLFDPTIYPLVKLWNVQGEAPRVPSQMNIDETLARVDYRKLHFNEEHRVYFEEEGMGVELGGIAKGYASMEAAKILREYGIETALLDFGGNILLMGEKPDGSPWRVGVRDPERAPNNYLAILEGLQDVAVVSSGNYERFFVQDEVRYHHILDPRTGWPVENELKSVSIVTRDATVADAMSTICYILGREACMQLIEEESDIEVIFITVDNKIYLSDGLRPFFRLQSGDYQLVDGT